MNIEPNTRGSCHYCPLEPVCGIDIQPGTCECLRDLQNALLKSQSTVDKAKKLVEDFQSNNIRFIRSVER